MVRPVAAAAVAATRGAGDAARVGPQIRRLRQQKGLTIQRLSQQSNVPGSTISKLENGQLRPSFVHAINLAAALQENLAFLTGRYRSQSRKRSVVRAADRETLGYPELGLTLYDISGRFAAGLLEGRVGVLAPGAHSGVEPMIHAGEEVCYVLEGAIRYRIGAETVVLQAREYLQFKCGIPHAWENAHPGPSRVLWLFSDGLSLSF